MSDTPQASGTVGLAEGTQPKTSRRRLLIAANLGTTLEYFDFVMFGVVSGLVLPKLFFSAMSPFVALLASFLTFGVGLLVRPLGALYFGHRADRVGRKRVMVMSLTMMGAATLCIGLLPGYATIGIAAPILLVLLRCLQGFSLGGELGTATVLALEYSPPQRRAVMTAVVQIGGPTGQILSSLTLLVVRGLVSESAFLSWAWRIPFLLGFAAAVVGLVIRSGIDESPVFRRAAAQLASLRRAPLIAVIREHPRLLVLLALNQAAPITVFYVCTVYFPSYLATNLRLPSSVAFAALLFGNVLSLPMLLVAGALADRYGRKPIIYVGSLATLVGVLPYFPLLNTRSAPLIVLATGLVLGGVYLTAGARNPLLAECFPTGVRNSAFNVVYSVALISGSPVPFLAAVLLHWTGTPWSIAAAMAAATVVGVAVVPFIPETVDRDIDNS